MKKIGLILLTLSFLNVTQADVSVKHPDNQFIDYFSTPFTENSHAYLIHSNGDEQPLQVTITRKSVNLAAETLLSHDLCVKEVLRVINAKVKSEKWAQHARDLNRPGRKLDPVDPLLIFTSGNAPQIRAQRIVLQRFGRMDLAVDCNNFDRTGEYKDYTGVHGQYVHPRDIINDYSEELEQSASSARKFIQAIEAREAQEAALDKYLETLAAE